MEPIEEKTEEDIFDVTLPKRKKKKKKTFDLDAVLGMSTDNGNKATGQEILENETKEQILIEDDNIDLEHFGKKKKKKKPKINLERSLTPNKIEIAKAEADNVAENDETNDLNVDFSKVKKKKKIKKSLDELCIDDSKENLMEQNLESDDEFYGGVDGGSGSMAWHGSDRDYTYDELLRRVYDIIVEKNPEMATGRKPKFVMRPPQVLRIGSKKTSFANFMDIAKTLHRKPKHLLDFLLAELGTSGSMDGNQQLIIKGRFQAKQIENVLRRYIKEYVTCHTCRSPDTILQKDTRLFFLQCESCGSRCSVASIKSGFQAVTSKRAAIRAKTT